MQDHHETQSALERIRAHIGVLVVLMAYLTVGFFYSVSSPIYESSDEFWHYAYVQYLVEGRGLPELDVAQTTHHVRQEVAQPPLYYAISALATFWIPTENLNEVLVNPHNRAGIPAYEEPNRNLYMHDASEDFPYQGNSLAIHVIRWLSLVIGAGTVIVTYLLMLRIRPGDRTLAALAAAFTAFNPQFLFISASVNNDNAINLLGSFGLLLIVGLVADRHTWRYSAVLGLVAALAILSKPGGLGLVPLAGLAILWIAWRGRSLPCFLKHAAAFLLPVLALTTWWFVRNVQVYNDPLAFEAHRAFGERVPTIGPLQLLADEGQGLWWSFWGVFGGFDVLAHPAVYTILTVATLVAGAGLVLGLIGALRAGSWRAWFKTRGTLAPSALVVGIAVLWLVVIVVAVIKWSLDVPASQGRLVFPAIAVTSVLLALGFAQIPLPKRAASWLAAIVLFAIAAIIPCTVLVPAYARPALASAASLGEPASPVHVTFNEELELVGCSLATDKVDPGEEMTVTCQWRVIARMEHDYSIFVHLLGVDRQGLGQIDTYPVGGAYRTSELEPGQGFVDTYRVVVSPEVKRPAMGLVRVGLYALPSFDPLPAADGQGAPVKEVLVGNFKIRSDASAQLSPSRTLAASFSEPIELVGCDVPSDSVAAGSSLPVTLYWRATGVPSRDYVVFVHLLGAADKVAQYDAQPLKGSLPTSKWERGDGIVDAVEVAIPPGTPPGTYTLIVGLYNLATGERPAVAGSTYVTLGEIDIVSAR